MMERVKFIWSWLWAFLKPFIRTFLTEVGRAVLMSARSAVLVAGSMPEGTSNEKRRKAAFAAIERDMKNIGYDIGFQVTESMINSAIEVALLGVKAESK